MSIEASLSGGEELLEATEGVSASSSSIGTLELLLFEAGVVAVVVRGAFVGLISSKSQSPLFRYGNDESTGLDVVSCRAVDGLLLTVDMVWMLSSRRF